MRGPSSARMCVAGMTTARSMVDRSCSARAPAQHRSVIGTRRSDNTRSRHAEGRRSASAGPPTTAPPGHRALAPPSPPLQSRSSANIELSAHPPRKRRPVARSPGCHEPVLKKRAPNVCLLEHASTSRASERATRSTESKKGGFARRLPVGRGEGEGGFVGGRGRAGGVAGARARAWALRRARANGDLTDRTATTCPFLSPTDTHLHTPSRRPWTTRARTTTTRTARTTATGPAARSTSGQFGCRSRRPPAPKPQARAPLLLSLAGIERELVRTTSRKMAGWLAGWTTLWCALC